MLKELFKQLYEKLKNEEKNNSNAISGSFRFFVENILEENYGKRNYINARTITDYYNKYVEGKDNNAGEPKSELKNLIAHYLGYQNYTDFKTLNNPEINIDKIQKTNQQNKSFKNGKILIVIEVLLVLTIATGVIMNSFKKDCIVWETNHYIPSSCKTQNSLDNSVYNINIEKFEKIEINEDTNFFENGIPVIWYGKSADGKMEYFTFRGIHPETLKELDPITEYIINKYVFSSGAFRSK